LGLIAGLLLVASLQGGCRCDARESLYAGGPTSFRYSRPIEDRVIDLPEDGDLWHLVVVSDNSAGAATLHQSIAKSPRIANLTTQVKLHAWPSSHWWVKQYLGGEALPIVLLTTEAGQSIYKASGRNLPGNAEELADEMESAIWAYDCPDCTTSPTRPNSKIPDMRGPNSGGGATPPLDGTTIGLLLLMALAGGAAYLANKPSAPGG
jgi:hypothetical protein